MSRDPLAFDRHSVSTIESRAVDRAMDMAALGAVDYDEAVNGVAAECDCFRDPLEILEQLEAMDD